MAGTIYLSDSEMETINYLRGQIADLLANGASGEFEETAEKWFKDIDNIERKFKLSSMKNKIRR